MQKTSGTWRRIGESKEGKGNRRKIVKGKEERKFSISKEQKKESGKIRSAIWKGKERRKKGRKINIKTFVNSLKEMLID